MPRKRNPQLIMYDVPVIEGDRDAEEATFLRYSNSFPDSWDIRVLFKRPGRGPFKHWILSVPPEAFNHLKGSSRAFYGFGSLKFREFSEPLRCYKCLKFGHLRVNCSVPKELCSRCTGEHSHMECTATTVACRICKEYNRRSGTGPKVKTDHSAMPARCPIFVREKVELGRHTNYGLKKCVRH
ncbi:hypothetical protein AVEN_93072-1 [Araneus ventricosus]|uniref:CCHC-type domain-containing protein n=1 Tax=Araneus ventricosus TaxID=182803 RepID=A0A4Y2S798_ARAVE|nr:hypothetical protein AVEN_93072-1 [Araneus ventricosus]